MLDQLENLVKKYAQEAVAESKEVPSDKSAVVSDAASSSIVDFLKSQASSNDISSLTSMLSGGNTEGMVKELIGGFTQKLSGQGFSLDSAKQIAMSLLPVIMAKMSGKSGGSGGIGDLLSQFGGGDVGSLLGGLMGGGKSSSSGTSKDGGLFGKMKDLLS